MVTSMEMAMGEAILRQNNRALSVAERDRIAISEGHTHRCLGTDLETRRMFIAYGSDFDAACDACVVPMIESGSLYYTWGCVSLVPGRWLGMDEYNADFESIDDDLPDYPGDYDDI